MPLASGTRLGPYEIVAPLGAGGMGEVYRARDTRLDRTVAIKILPDFLAADPQFRERFEREAKTISQLDHPHICPLYDVGDQAGAAFLVMQCLEGETLAERIARSPVPLHEALIVAVQIAQALDYAHRAGVVHRDLKPGNIFLTPTGAKLLDFGLAKQSVGRALLGPPGGSRPASPDLKGPAYVQDLTSPQTMTTPLTGQGAIVGTFQYMSPEQLEGKDVDARADTFAFGAVLFEMIAGRRAFQGKTQFTVMGAILEHDPPPISSVASSVPPALDRIIQKCLAKDPAKRWQSMADLADELKWIAEQAPSTSRVQTDAAAAATTPTAGATPSVVPRVRLASAATVGLIAGLAIAAGAWFLTRPAPEPSRPPTRFAIVPPPAMPLAIQGADRDIAISPDGTYIAYRAGTGQTQLVVRRIDQLEAQPLAGISSPRVPFFSRDSRWIGFFEGGQIKKVSVTGGPAIALCRVTGVPRGASWAEDNTIVFATNDPSTGLLSVSAGGGEPKELTKPDVSQREGDHFFPSVLPGSRSVLFTITTPGQAENSQIVLVDLTSGQRRTLIRGGSNAEYVDTGHLVYAAGGTLRAVRFDLARLEVQSDPFPVVEHVAVSTTGAANYGISRHGTLVYVPGGAQSSVPRSLVWVNRQGREEAIVAPPRNYSVLRLSPDGTRVALEIRDQEGDIWIWDLARQTLTRLTFDPALDQQPVWTSDGRRVVFSSGRNGPANLFAHAADGTGADERLTTSLSVQFANSAAPDGTGILGFEAGATAPNIVFFRLPALGATPTSATMPGSSPPAQPRILLKNTFTEINVEISPDGRYIAYQSNESGQNQIYVRPFPSVDAGRWQVSTGGGTRPAWARNGRELFYLDGSNALTSVPVQMSGSSFSAGNPARVLETRYAAPLGARSYDVAPDGQRFLMIKDLATADEKVTPASLVVVERWFEELKARLPAR